MKRRKRSYSKLAVLLSLSILATSIILPAPLASAAKIKLNKTKLNLTVGNTYKLKLSGKKGKIKWTSSKKKVASVSAKGVVKAKKAGKTTITALMKGKKYKCKVTVKKAQQNKPKTTTKPTTSAPSKVPSTDSAAPSLLPSQTPFVIPTPIPTPNITPENPNATPEPTNTEPPDVPLEPSELAKNISIKTEVLAKNILISVTNHNATWIGEVTINYDLFDTEGNNINASFATIPSMQPEETLYITVSNNDEIVAIDEEKSTIEIEVAEADKDIRYLDITEKVALTKEQYNAPNPVLSVNLVNHSKYDTDIAYTIFYYDADQNIKDADSHVVSLNAKNSITDIMDLPLDENTELPLYDHYEIVYSAHGTEYIDPLESYIEKITLTPQKNTNTMLIDVKNTNSIWLRSINLEYHLYDAEDNFLMNAELALLSMQPGETQQVTITADSETIESIDLDQSYVNITLEIDKGEYSYNTTRLVNSTITKTDENDYEITISNQSTYDTEGSYVVYFYDANSKIIAAEYDIYELPSRDSLTFSISGPESYDEEGNPVYASRCSVKISASHTLTANE